jgi:diguanylate cyclase (GGDEF)-like protein
VTSFSFPSAQNTHDTFMYGIDIVSGYVICGAAALAGSLMMRLMRTESPRTAQALRLFAAGLACTGLGLSAFLLAYDLPMDWISRGSATAQAVGLALAGWALRELNGYRTPPRTGWLAVGATALLMLVCWTVLGPLAFGVAFSVVGLALATGICASQWRFVHGALQNLQRPADTALALAMAGFVMVWLLRMVFTLGYQGPAMIHHLYVPEPLVGAFMLAYATMPPLATAVLMVVVNARLVQQLERRALTDELTGLTSRRGLRELGPGVLQRAADRLQDVAVLMLDIDHLKRVNEQHGALVGDDVLRHVGRRLKQTLRSDAMLARHGGEEFALLVPLDHAATAAHVAERLRMTVEKRPCSAGDVEVAVTASLGLTLHRTGEALDQALMRADHLLYQAKASGRNCICDDLDAPIELDRPIQVDLPLEGPLEATVANNGLSAQAA